MINEIKQLIYNNSDKDLLKKLNKLELKEAIIDYNNDDNNN